MGNDREDKQVRTTELIRTGRSWDGAELPDYLQGRPEIVAIKYDVPAGEKLGWHHHPVMNFGILVQGELTIVSEEGTEKVVHEGEAVVNALYHRDYQLREPVEITIEPERISILSHSGPDRSISMAAIKEAKILRSRRYRNRRLGEFLKELDLTEGRATGIPTIQDELRKNGSSKATIETDDDRTFFLIDIPSHPYWVNLKDEMDKLRVLLTDRQLQIVNYLRESNKINQTQIANDLNVSRQTIHKEIKTLVKLGVLTKDSSRKTGAWKLSYFL